MTYSKILDTDLKISLSSVELADVVLQDDYILRN